MLPTACASTRVSVLSCTHTHMHTIMSPLSVSPFCSSCTTHPHANILPFTHCVLMHKHTPLPLTPAHTHTSPSHTTSHTSHSQTPSSHTPPSHSLSHTPPSYSLIHTPHSHTPHLTPTPLTLTHTPPPHTHTSSHPHTHPSSSHTHLPSHPSSCEERLTSVKCPVLRLACSTTSDWGEQLWSQCTGKLECKTLNLI